MGESIAGPAPSGWIYSPLGALAKGGIQGGPFGSQLHASDYVPDGIPVIMPKNIGANRFRLDSFDYITESDAARLSQHRVEAGDIVVGRKGDLSKQVFVSSRESGWFCGTDCIRIRPDHTVTEPRYLSFYFGLVGVGNWLHRYDTGSTLPSLNTSSLAALPVLMPPLSEQRAIAGVLGALDDKIDANTKIRAAASELAASLLEYHLCGAAEAGTLTIEPLCEVASVNLRSIKPSAGQIQYLDISAVGNGESRAPESIPWSAAPSRARRVTVDGDTLWSTVRPNRRSHCLLLNPPLDLVVSTGFAVLSPRAIGPSLLYGLTDRDDFVDYLVSMADGSAYPAVRADCFNVAPLPLPPESARRQFEDAAMPLHRRAEAARRESEDLAQLRDTLLPKLLSGKLRVRQAEELVEGAV